MSSIFGDVPGIGKVLKVYSKAVKAIDVSVEIFATHAVIIRRESKNLDSFRENNNKRNHELNKAFRFVEDAQTGKFN